MTKRLFILIGFFSVFFSSAQTTIKGSVNDAVTYEPIPNVSITIEETFLYTKSDVYGKFIFTGDLPLGEHVLNLTKAGYETARYPIIVNHGATVDISDMILKIDVSDAANFALITLSDDELNNDSYGADNISGLLQASKDVLLRTAAFEFSPSFFKVRGLDSEHGKVLINGIEMNKMFNGRPQWSNWGGLNDVMRNQVFTNGILPSAYNYGGILGTTNISTRASLYRKGGRVTYSSANRSYTNRAMASFSSGLISGGWAYSISIGRRWGNEGYQEATFYDANSFFGAVEKRINDKHSLNFTGIFSPNRRGKSSPNTQEVYDLKDIKYNEYWGHQENVKRNSRVKRSIEPILMLNHNWAIDTKTTLNTNIAYQFGVLGNSRLDYSGGANPSPAYYQLLPSYFLADDNPDYAGAYIAEQNFINDGQINWNSIYDANLTNTIVGLPGAYALYEDRSDDKQFSVNSIIHREIHEHLTINGSVNYSNLKSENFAEITDLLGGSGYLNVDPFDQYQYDLKHPGRIVGEGGKFKYHYVLTSKTFGAQVQAQFKYYKIDFYFATNYRNTEYQRDGIFQHEAYVTQDDQGNITDDNSFGKGRKLKFNGYGIKTGAVYKLTGRHVFSINLTYNTRAPWLRNTYSNSRENNSVVGDFSGIDITEEKIMASDVSYFFRSPIVQARVTGYYTAIRDANEISFYFADGVGGDSQAFVQEILQGINKKHFGIELGIEAKITPTIKLKAAASYGQFTYDNNPLLVLTSEDFEDEYKNLGKANLKNYKLAVGPQKAYSIGFEYRDPDYWWIGITGNFFNEAYLDISPLTRTENFYLDDDGLPFNDYDPEIANELLKQEKFENYMVVNAIGGKSWKIGDYFVGVFASINNILDKKYKTGGFEQGRNANYRELRDDNANPKRVFGPKYWFGRGTNYFLNVSFRF